MASKNTRVVILSVLLTAFGIGIGVIIGYFSHPSSSESPQQTEDESAIEKLMNEMKAENIRNNLREITRKPHIAGRYNDEVNLVNLITDQWKAHGLDSVVVKPYNVLLSYPKQNDSNYVAIVDADGNESDVSQRKELVIDEEQNDPDVVDPFNAYSAAGEPEGDLVYVNYGTIEDFIDLNRTLKIDLNDKICIARYGQIFRGDKANHAQQYGCAGLILYSDPADYTVPWAGVYPNDWYLPGTGAQRGTLWVDNGDPRTPNYPSIATAWHKSEEEVANILPAIPVTPIGYDDAVKYLEKMTGDEVTEAWRGRLNITYRYGPGFNDSYKDRKLKLYVKTKNENETIHNVVGYIRGSTEPDRYVILGNHRDAWVFGAIDPSSGTAALMEVVRAFGEMKRKGWRPRRTIIFCSWGGEEYGLIGSTEWTEELQKELQARAVAYLNVDPGVNGNHTLSASGVATFRDIVYDAAKLVKNPDPKEIANGRETVYDTWSYRTTGMSSDLPSFPALGSGSDHASFIHTFGISSINMGYTYDRSSGVASYPVYHSVYETFELVSKYVDPDFAIHQAVAQVWAEIGRKLADATLLPIDCRLYARDLEEKRDEFFVIYGESFKIHNIDTEQLNNAINEFKTAAESIHRRTEELDLSNALELRAMNDQLMQLERAFTDQNPLPGRTAYRHVINAPSQHNRYGNSPFPGLSDALFDIDADPDQEGRWDEVKRQYSILVFHILSAASTLAPFVPET